MRWKLVVVLAIVAGGGGAIWLLAQKSEPHAVVPAADLRPAKATPPTGARVLRLSGLTSARQFVNINAPKVLGGPEGGGNAMILLKLVKAGSPVKKGQLIAEIDSQSVKDHVDDVTDIVRQAKSDIVKRQAEHAVAWDQAQHTLRQPNPNSPKPQPTPPTPPPPPH